MKLCWDKEVINHLDVSDKGTPLVLSHDYKSIIAWFDDDTGEWMPFGNNKRKGHIPAIFNELLFSIED